MLNKTENLEAIRYPEYDRTFWNIVRGKAVTKPLEGVLEGMLEGIQERMQA